MNLLDTLLNFNKIFTLYLVFPCIFVLGFLLTIKLKGVQIAKLRLSLMSIFKTEENSVGNISHYQAVASVLASNFGTGNISGMAVALSTGGPGALVWMWVMAFFGSVIQYANCLLGVKYRKKNDKGEFVGGPMYYISKGLGMKKMAILFSLCLILGAFSVGVFAQVNSVALPLKTLGIAPWMTGVVITFFVSVVILGGARRVSTVSSAIVPIMALLYLGTSLYIIVYHRASLGSALSLMWHSAISPMPVMGGTLGFSVLKALTTGFDRAIFATDAGTGTVPILQSGAKMKHPVTGGIMALLPPFLVMLVCTATGLVLILTGAYQRLDLQSTNMVTFAFQSCLPGNLGIYIVLVSLLLFAYTTMITWASCLERAIDYLFGMRPVKIFLIFYILAIPLGTILEVNLVWVIADIAITSMLVINLFGVAGLSKQVISESQNFFKKNFINN